MTEDPSNYIARHTQYYCRSVLQGCTARINPEYQLCLLQITKISKLVRIWIAKGGYRTHDRRFRRIKGPGCTKWIRGRFIHHVWPGCVWWYVGLVRWEVDYSSSLGLSLPLSAEVQKCDSNDRDKCQPGKDASNHGSNWEAIIWKCRMHLISRTNNITYCEWDTNGPEAVGVSLMYA